MAEDEENINEDNIPEKSSQHEDGMQEVTSLSGLYKDWFLDYSSYVILERAVPALEDGLKPVQRRIMHSMKELDDGRYNKVANIIGNTMKYHPHGDASIGDALVQVGQKEIVVDMQGNWGNVLTGDRAAAARYIEARLSKFAKDVMFNPKTTEWTRSYDGRNKEPQHLPIKFPLLLAQGAEGIAVGLACKILPHNFNELIDGCIQILKNKPTNILPDFINGGMADFSQYNDGLRGGKVRVRAKIKQLDKKTIVIHEIPFGTTTTSVIESVIKANDHGKIKIKKIEDNTSTEVEIVILLHTGTSPDKTIDALYAFTDCEVSISPNACVIFNNKPVFLGVNEMLQLSTERTLLLLKRELEIRNSELEELWHFASLEQLFIEKRIYRDIEEVETWEGVISAIFDGIHKYVSTPGKKNQGAGIIKLIRDITETDIIRLTEIKIKRISKFDSNKALSNIANLEKEIKSVLADLNNLVEYAIRYFKDLKKKYGDGRDRKTEIKIFENISKTKVIVSNRKLYVNKKEGFVGWGLRKDEYVSDCSDIDDIIVFRTNGTMKIVKVADKVFIGKNIIHVNVWKKGDERTIYHMIYKNGAGGNNYVKRFPVTSITRDKEYNLGKGKPDTKVLYFTANPNGEAEVIQIILRAKPKLKKLKFEYDFSELAIKGRNANGNIITKHIIKKITQKELGDSTLSARKIWFDDVTQRLNDECRGELIGEFSGADYILVLLQTGEYIIYPPSLTTHFDEELIHIEKYNPLKPISAVYFDGYKNMYMIKRFIPKMSSKKVKFISEHAKSFLEFALIDLKPVINVKFHKQEGLPDQKINIWEFIDIKGVKAKGNRLSANKIQNIESLEPVEPTTEELLSIQQKNPTPKSDEVLDISEKETVEEGALPENEIIKNDENGQQALF